MGWRDAGLRRDAENAEKQRCAKSRSGSKVDFTQSRKVAKAWYWLARCGSEGGTQRALRSEGAQSRNAGLKWISRKDAKALRCDTWWSDAGLKLLRSLCALASLRETKKSCVALRETKNRRVAFVSVRQAHCIALRLCVTLLFSALCVY